MVLVDTSVWSLALRRQQPQNVGAVAELQYLIQTEQVQIIGPIRQELLSGIREQAQFEALQNHLRTFPDLPLSTTDYEQAADFFNLARSRGIQGSNTDFLICAVAAEYDMPILTTDKDFEFFQTHLPIKLHQWG
ncbi:UDP-N-acetylglucosamine 2-epimerase [hydrothermal vent metagenome]|uniref:UDP-N-acetylglucosamine 2-epimerase n=1 Tax=hydrothermal vent metagenome TaxID=652676 RepID=A0A3B0VFQ5_9ZZZZ